jgi:hypothetical protein
MPTIRKVSALDHAMHTAQTWINDVARETSAVNRCLLCSSPAASGQVRLWR